MFQAVASAGEKAPFIFTSSSGKFPAMRGILSFGAIFLLPGALCLHAETALDAIRELPKDQALRIARIEARDGTPAPDRWYILTHDPAAESGVHEFVVSKGEVVASRGVSQFAESLTADEILAPSPLNIDSDTAAKLARAYAEANGAAITTINYELKKDAPDAAPAWTISCLDDKGNKVGVLVLTAGSGAILSHTGFAREPDPAATPKSREKTRDEPRAKPEGPAHHHGSPSPAKPPSPVQKTLQDVGRTLQKFNPF